MNYLQEIVNNPVASLAIVGNLIIIESLLSVDNDDGRLKYQKNLDNITVLQNNEFKEIGNSYGESKFDTYNIN